MRGSLLRRVAFAGAAMALSSPLIAAPTSAKSPVKARAHSPARVAMPAPVPIPSLPQSDAASRLIAWVALEHDNRKLPFIVVDKQAAALFLFDAKGRLLGSEPVLLGVGVGDDSSPGVGAKSLADIGPAERTTPAGRFVAKFGRAFGRQRVLWVDYANSVALHAVITTHKAERRVERLESPEVDDNRITFGCINVATRFYARKVRPLFEKKGGIVYILPDTRTLDDVFPRVRLLPYLDRGAATLVAGS